jgi:hypothetical protein
MTPCFWNRRKACPSIKENDRRVPRHEAVAVVEVLPPADVQAEAAVDPEAADPNPQANPDLHPAIADDAPAKNKQHLSPPYYPRHMLHLRGNSK